MELKKKTYSRITFLFQLIGAVCVSSVFGLIPKEAKAFNLAQPVAKISPSAIPAEYRSAFANAQAKLSTGDANAAYQELLALQPPLAGIPVFDLVFGQAALQVDKPSIAAFSFERCLAVDSYNELCRLGMFHAHLDLKEKKSAKQELHYLKQSAQNEEVQKAIAHYLDVISPQEARSQAAQLASYMQVGVGYDSNINSASSINEIAIPNLDDEMYILPDEHQRKKSGFMTAKYHIRYSAPINEQWRFRVQGDVAAKGNFKTSNYNTLVSHVSAGVDRTINQHQLSATVRVQNYRLRNRNFRNMGSFIAQYAYTVNNTTEISIFGQASKLNYSGSRYAPDNSRRNAKRYVGGATLLKGFASERALGYLTAYGGTHKKTKSRGPAHINHQFFGAKVGGMYLLTPRFQMEAGVAAERRHFRKENLNFLKKRKDTFYNAYLGGVYAVNRKLTLRPQYQFYRNHSNIPLSHYKRHIFMLNLRYDLL